MGYAFEIFFDSYSESALREVWQELSRHDLLSPGLQDDARPHMSLAVCDGLDIERSRLLLDDFCASHSRFELYLCFIGTFVSADNVVFVSPQMTERLRRIHEDLHISLGSQQPAMWGHYLPGTWQPHCTMTTDVAETTSPSNQSGSWNSDP